jgi:hypothetical protein
MGKSVNIEIKMPRVYKRQTQRENFISENSEMYFKCSIFIPFLDYLIELMDTRFNQRLIDVMPLEGLIPANLNMYNDENIVKAAKIYVQDLHDDTSHLQSELSCSYGDNNGDKILFQNRILLLIQSLIAPISNLTLK